jgi:hypothetical protein
MHKTHGVGSYTSKTSQLNLPEQISRASLDSMFCRGRCTEATRFDDLCPACVAEYFDYQGERNV